MNHWNVICDKCGQQMHGPYYDRPLGRLKFKCDCGYETTRATLDRDPVSAPFSQPGRGER